MSKLTKFTHIIHGALADDNQQTNFNLDQLAFDKQGLIPTIIQCDRSGDILMFAWANLTSLRKSIETGLMHFYSRSKQRLWCKGELSGNLLKITSMYADCDGDCLLVKVTKPQAACHTGNTTCFFAQIHYEKTPLASEQNINLKLNLNPEAKKYILNLIDE